MRVLLLAMCLAQGAAAADDLSNSVGVTASATSSAVAPIPGDEKKTVRWDAERVVNGQLDRGWCEGAHGPGLREAVTLQLSRPMPVKSVVLSFSTEPDALAPAHDVPSAITVEAPGQSPVRLEMFGGRWEKEARATLSGDPVDRITVRIAGVHKPTHEDTCISELRMVGPKGPFTLWVGLGEDDRAAVAALMRDARAAFVSCDPARLAKVLGPHFRADGRDELPAAEVAARCKTGHPVAATEGPLEATESTGRSIRFELDAKTWTVRRYGDAWLLESAPVG
jgi:hypothetical protein